MVASETRARKTAKPSRWRLRWRTWLVRLGVLAVALMVALPVLMMVVYMVVPPVSTLMVRDLVTLQGYKRDWIALEDVSPHITNSILASEDQTFCSHTGVEWSALQAQFERWRAGEDARGASTVSMQVARALFLWQGRSVVRKALEVPVAVVLDLVWSKRRMMEVYLNVVETGPRLYGFEAAARRAFDRSAADVGRRQAALLVAALPLPSQRDAARPSRRQARLAEIIVSRARQMGAYNTCLQTPAA